MREHVSNKTDITRLSEKIWEVKLPNKGDAEISHKKKSDQAVVFNSNGPDVRIRGTAIQILNKYEELAEDAMASGDSVLAESYLQHAEYFKRYVHYAPDVKPLATSYRSYEVPENINENYTDCNFIEQNVLNEFLNFCEEILNSCPKSESFAIQLKNNRKAIQKEIDKNRFSYTKLDMLKRGKR